MPTPDLIQGINLPTFGDAPAVPTHIADIWYAAISRGNPRFANTAARDAAYPTPTNGQKCWVDALLAEQIYQSGWKNTWIAPGPGVWQAYTPAVFGITTSAVTAQYCSVGGLITVRAKITASGAATAEITVNLPVAAATPFDTWLEPIGNAYAIVGGGGVRYAGTAVLAATDRVGVGAPGSTNATARWGSSATNPGTWASGDRLYLGFTYQAI